jgi:hypothetical protein
MNLAIHMRLAHPPGDQLGDLGAEIEDENFGMLHANRKED